MSMLGKYLNPRNDYAFKRIFGTEKNKDILVDFINAMLGFEGSEKIQNVAFLSPVQDPDIASKKQSIVDVLCTDEIGQQYIIEMQVAHTSGFEKRAQYYAARAYSNQLDTGEKYHELKAIIFVAITNFVMFPDKKDYKSDHVILDKETYDHDLKDFSFTFLELPKFNKSMDELNTIVERWAYFFKNAEETREDDIVKVSGEDIAIQKAYKELSQFNWNKQELLAYEQEEKHERDAQAILDYKLEVAEKKGIEKGKAEGEKQGMKKGMKKGMEKGMEKGIEKGIEKGRAQGQHESQKAIAKKLLAQGIDIAIIAESTGLTVSEIELISSEQVIA